MEYNKHLDIENLKHEGYKDQATEDLAVAVYNFRRFLAMYDASTDEDVYVHRIEEFTDTLLSGEVMTSRVQRGIFLFMAEELLPGIYDSKELRPIIDACEKAITEIYGDKIFADARKEADESYEANSKANEGEDNDDVYETTDEELKEYMAEDIIPCLAFINMALYITYDNQYDLLQLKDYDNNEFWYNEYIDTFINHFNYLDFFIVL